MTSKTVSPTPDHHERQSRGQGATRTTPQTHVV